MRTFRDTKGPDYERLEPEAEKRGFGCRAETGALLIALSLILIPILLLLVYVLYVLSGL